MSHDNGLASDLYFFDDLLSHDHGLASDLDFFDHLFGDGDGLTRDLYLFYHLGCDSLARYFNCLNDFLLYHYGLAAGHSKKSHEKGGPKCYRRFHITSFPEHFFLLNWAGAALNYRN